MVSPNLGYDRLLGHDVVILGAMIDLVCSNRPRAQSGGGRLHQWWSRDVFHATNDGAATLCGLSTADWLRMEAREMADVETDPNLCRRCAAKLKD